MNGSAGGDKSIPNKQHEQSTDGRADEPRTLIKSIPTDSLADKSCDERTGDSERGRQYETSYFVRTRRDDTRYYAGNEPDHDDPNNVRHSDLSPFAWKLADETCKDPLSSEAPYTKCRLSRPMALANAAKVFPRDGW